MCFNWMMIFFLAKEGAMGNALQNSYFKKRESVSPKE